MAIDVDELYEKASNLSPSERAALAGLLIDTLEGAVDPETERAWRVEVAKRLAELDAGAVTTIPGAAVHDRLREIVDDLSS
jgi:putative addiction module component (TIGR02574 family)